MEEYKHPWLEKFNQKKQEEIDKAFVEQKHEYVKHKYGTKTIHTLYGVEKRAVLKLDKEGNFELVAKCNTHKEAEDEIKWRMNDVQVHMTKEPKAAKVENPHKGTYVIVPIYEIR